MLVDTRFIHMESLAWSLGSLYTIIGDTHSEAGADAVRIRARVVRCVDGLDLDLFEQALILRRQFEQSGS